MKPYSVDLRKRIVQAINDKKTPEEVSTMLRVSTATIHRYLQLDRDLNDLAPLKGTGRPRLIPVELEPALLEQIQANNDATLEQHCRLWRRRTGATISPACMAVSQKRIGVTVKILFTPVNATRLTASPGSKPSARSTRSGSCSSTKPASTSA